MKGGKGGQGRKRSTERVEDKTKPKPGGPKRGDTKKDWGAIERDEPREPALPAPARVAATPAAPAKPRR